MPKIETEERPLLVTISFAIGAAMIVLAVLILPENCLLFDSNKPGPQMCHTIPPSEDCQFLCEDTSTAYSASLVAGIGIGFFFLPLLIMALKNARKPSDRMNRLLD